MSKLIGTIAVFGLVVTLFALSIRTCITEFDVRVDWVRTEEVSK